MVEIIPNPCVVTIIEVKRAIVKTAIKSTITEHNKKDLLKVAEK